MNVVENLNKNYLVIILISIQRDWEINQNIKKSYVTINNFDINFLFGLLNIDSKVFLLKNSTVKERIYFKVSYRLLIRTIL